jgi:putative ABC transport system permease protein
VLRYQGAGAAGDVYASAAPVLLAVGVAVVLVRVYPLLVRVTLRMCGQRASAATFLGLAQAARASVAAALPAFALVLALALVSFAGMERAAVAAGEVAASWQQAGADAVITARYPVTPALQRDVAAVPGVQRIAAAGIATIRTSGGDDLDAVAVGPAQYARLVAGTPLPQPPQAFTASAGAGAAPLLVAPALAAPGLAAALGSQPFGLLIEDYYIQARVLGQAASMTAFLPVSNGYLVLPSQALGALAPQPNVLLVNGQDLNQAALRAVVARDDPGSRVAFRSELLAGLENAPLEHGAYLAMTLGGVAASICGLLVLLLSLLLSATTRRLAVARMSTMGLSGGQARLLGVVELLPQLLAVVVGGLGCAVAMVPLIGPALSLEVFSSSANTVPPQIEPQWLVLAGAGLLVLAVATLMGETMLTDRTTARSIRIGD